MSILELNGIEVDMPNHWQCASCGCIFKESAEHDASPVPPGMVVMCEECAAEMDAWEASQR